MSYCKLRYIVIFALFNMPLMANADIASYKLRYRDGRGAGVHVVPVDNKSVRMASERVVLVPFYDLKTNQVKIFTCVWYDMVSDTDLPELRVGFPELKSLVEKDLNRSKRPWAAHDESEYSWEYPTIAGFKAWTGDKQLSAVSYKGIGPYRRWFSFGFPLKAKKKVRIYNSYISNPGRLVIGDWGDDNEKRGRTTRYFVHYILHTGSMWSGSIGSGEVFLYQKGELINVKKFSNLKPGKSDDIHIMLDAKLVEWDRKESDPHKQWSNKIPDLKLRFPFAGKSSGKTGSNSHPGSAVDGDPTTFWTSTPDAAIGSFIQLPSNPEKGLLSVSITPGTMKGTVRPSSLQVYCLNQKRQNVLGNLSLPDAPQGISLKLSKEARCEAIRIEVKGVHGLNKSAVSIAEISQEFRKKTVMKLQTAPKPKDFHDQATVTPDSKKLSFNRLWYNEVHWSLDGRNLHYCMYRENTGNPLSGVAFGYIIDSITGRNLLTYRITKYGTLSPAVEKEWEKASPLSEGIKVVTNGSWGPEVKPGRLSMSINESWNFQMVPEIRDAKTSLQIKTTDNGFKWIYAPPETKAEQHVKFKFLIRNKSGKEHQLTLQTPSADPVFSSRHRKTWNARRRYYKDLVNVFHNQWSNDDQLTQTNLPDEVWKHIPEVWHRLTYQYDEAYSGDASVYWEPGGRAVAVMLRHRTDLSSLKALESSSKFPKDKDGYLNYLDENSFFEKHISHCARDLLVMVCPRDRHDSASYTTEVAVRSLIVPEVTKKLPDQSKVTAPTMAPPEKRTTHSRPGGCACKETPTDGENSHLLLWFIFGVITIALLVFFRSRAVLMIPVFIIGSLWTAYSNVRATGDSLSIKLIEFDSITIPAGGRAYAPEGMEGVLYMSHYRTPEKALSVTLRAALKSNGWTIRKDKEGYQHRMLTPAYREFEVQKGKVIIYIAVYRYSTKESILFITKK